MNREQWDDQLARLSPKYGRIKRPENRVMICELAEHAWNNYGLKPMVDSYHTKTGEHEGFNWEGKFALLIIRLEKSGFDLHLKGSREDYVAAGIPEAMFPSDASGVPKGRPGTTRLNIADDSALRYARIAFDISARKAGHEPRAERSDVPARSILDGGRRITAIATGENELLQRITTNPTVFGGKPIIRGRRLAVEHILGMLAVGDTPETILAGYDWLEPADIQACMAYARRLVGHERVEPALNLSSPGEAA